MPQKELYKLNRNRLIYFPSSSFYSSSPFFSLICKYDQLDRLCLATILCWSKESDWCKYQTRYTMKYIWNRKINGKWRKRRMRTSHNGHRTDTLPRRVFFFFWIAQCIMQTAFRFGTLQSPFEVDICDKWIGFIQRVDNKLI